MMIHWLVLIALTSTAILNGQDAVQLIFDRVAGTFLLRDPRRPPTLRVAASKEGTSASAAFFDPEAREIVIDQRLIDHFRSNSALGDDAIAFVLGHELGHFYGDDTLRLGVASSSSSSPEALEKLRRIEEQADWKALLHSHLAGYRGAIVGPTAIRALYGFYGLKPELPGYPSLEARASGTDALVQYLSRLLPLYPLATALILNGDIAEASMILEHLSDRFQSPDLLHNAAVLQARLGLSKTPKVVRYAALYPFLYSSQNNLAKSIGEMRGGDSEDGRVYLESAEQRFRQVLRSAPQDPSTRINLALVLDLLGRAGEGLRLLNGDESFAGSMQTHRLMAQAILWHHSGQTAKAAQTIRGLKANNKPLWDAFIKNVPPAVVVQAKAQLSCPDLLQLAERSGFGSSSLWTGAQSVKGIGKIPGDSYDLSLQTVHSQVALAARTRSFQTTLQVVQPLKLHDAEQQELSSFLRQSTPTAELAGFPISYRFFRAEACSFALGERSGKVIEMLFIGNSW